MKLLSYGLALSLGLFAQDASAVRALDAEEANFSVTELMEECRNMTGTAEEKVACFNAVSQLIQNQGEVQEKSGPSVPEALKALRAAAEYQNDDTGLSITGTDCNVQFVYFNNYFHISRRNVSTIDLFSASFDASNVDPEPEVRGGGPLAKGAMDDGATALTSGGLALDSKQQNFSAKSARTTIADYANEVISQLPAAEAQTFEFVLIHPERQNAAADILSAFEAFVTACNQ